jgi:hypothetical protein
VSTIPVLFPFLTFSQGVVVAKLPDSKNVASADDAFVEPEETWLPGQDRRALEPTMGIEPRTTDFSRVQGDPTIGDLHAKVSDEGGVQRLRDIDVLESLASEAGVTGKDLLGVLSRRLGLVETETAKATEMKRLDAVHTAARDLLEDAEDEYDSDDDLFNAEDDGLHVISSNLQFIEQVVGDTPQTAEERAALNRRDRAQQTSGKSPEKMRVPPLPFGRHEKGQELVEVAEMSSEHAAWRRLPKYAINPSKFFSQFKKTHTLGPDASTSNQVNKPTYLLPVVSREYVPEQFEFPYAAEFASDARKEMVRAVELLDSNLRREEEIARLAVPLDESLGAQEMTSVDIYLARQQAAAKQALIADQADQMVLSVAELRAETIAKAIMAAKTSDVGAMEEALDVDIEGTGISPDIVTDEQGNTLLILAAQQGSKRMCKLLLRRGGNINRQNALSGNTCLHYCCLFSNDELAKYLISKGADDSLLNAERKTCYEARLSSEDYF